MEDLCFGSGPSVLVAYTDSDMAGDIDSKKSISGYLVAFAGGTVHDNLSCKSVWHYPLGRPSTLLLLKLARKCCG